MTTTVDESKLIGYKEIDGQQVPIYRVKSETIISNSKTGALYSSEEEANADVADPNSPTTQDNIRRDVKIYAPQLSMGATNLSE
tara:strand:+ start:690 stop:941 length:252 start_codon:yes stop_codon:yes gene_type:complete